MAENWNSDLVVPSLLLLPVQILEQLTTIPLCIIISCCISAFIPSHALFYFAQFPRFPDPQWPPDLRQVLRRLHCLSRMTSSQMLRHYPGKAIECTCFVLFQSPSIIFLLFYTILLIVLKKKLGSTSTSTIIVSNEVFGRLLVNCWRKQRFLRTPLHRSMPGRVYYLSTSCPLLYREQILMRIIARLSRWWSVFWVLFTAKSNGTGTEEALLYTQVRTNLILHSYWYSSTTDH